MESTPAWTRRLRASLTPAPPESIRPGCGQCLGGQPCRTVLSDRGRSHQHPLGLGVPRSIIQIQSFSLKAKVRDGGKSL